MSEKLTFTDMFNTEKVTQGVQLYNIAMLLVLTFVIIILSYNFLFPGIVLGIAAEESGPDRLSVARTEKPFHSHLYRTRDYPTEMQSSLRSGYVYSASPSCAAGLSHPEPWDRWNPPRCGGYWAHGR